MLDAKASTSNLDKSGINVSNDTLFQLSPNEVLSSVGTHEREEYEQFCQLRASKLTVGLLLTWFALCSLFMLITAMIYGKNRIIFIAIAASYFLIRNPMMLMLICFKAKGRAPSNAQSWFANLSTVQSSICMGLFLVGRVMNGHCESVDIYHIYSCNPEHSSHALPQDVVFGLLFIPVMVSTIFKSVKLQSAMISWFSAVFFFSLAVWLGDAQRSIPLLVFYVPVSLMVMYENYRQDIILFLMSRKKEALLEENKQLSEEAQTELRFMIANMAHDLKTVSVCRFVASACHLSMLIVAIVSVHQWY